MIVLTDWALEERELNQDQLDGVPPGTNTSERKAREARSAAWLADAPKRAAARAARKLELQGKHPTASDRVINIMLDYAYMSFEEAVKFVDKVDGPAKPMTKAQQRKANAKAQRDSDAYWERQRRQSAKFDQSAIQAGRAAAENVGLDGQVKHSPKKELT